MHIMILYIIYNIHIEMVDVACKVNKNIGM